MDSREFKVSQVYIGVQDQSGLYSEFRTTRAREQDPVLKTNKGQKILPLAICKEMSQHREISITHYSLYMDSKYVQFKKVQSTMLEKQRFGMRAERKEGDTR